MNNTPHFIGIDVGTGSARAGVFDLEGTLLAHATREIRTWKPQADFVQQSSDDLWRAVSQCVRKAVAEAGIDPSSVTGIGFDATCSLVAVDMDGRPLTVSPDGDPEQDVIVWMDHRAAAIADEVNAGDHEVLRYVGGRISPEMETPKILWLRRNLPATYEKAAHFFDLPDFLTWRATGDATRSLCSAVCKMTYLGHEDRWDPDYFAAIGLEDHVADDFARLGQRVRPMGEQVGEGLTRTAADELGLSPGTAVSVSIIDAHAGGIGMLGAAHGDDALDFNRRLAIICGTSSCHMAASPEPRFIDGVWGPYFGAMVPGYWLTEGGQSAVGSLLDHVVEGHPAWDELKAEAKDRHPYALLNAHLESLAKDGGMHTLTRDLHVFPDFHGNRSPRADPHLRGMISGLRLSATRDDLALLYLATVQALACGTRHIVEALNAAGYAIDTLVACGGHANNPLFLQAHADATGCRIILPREQEAVLLGGAMLGATAAGHYPALPAAMASMSAAGQVIEPVAATMPFHVAKYRVFHRMHDDQRAYTEAMQAAR